LEDEWPALSRRRVVLAEAGRRQNAKIKRIEAKGNVIVVQKGESTTAFHLVEMPPLAPRACFGACCAPASTRSIESCRANGDLSGNEGPCHQKCSRIMVLHVKNLQAIIGLDYGGAINDFTRPQHHMFRFWFLPTTGAHGVQGLRYCYIEWRRSERTFGNSGHCNIFFAA
jgi:hypothetical protein